MTIKTQAFLQGYLHDKAAARKPGTGTGRARRGYDTQDFGWAEQLNAASKAVPGGLWQGVKNLGRGAQGLAETAAGAIGTAGAAVSGVGEAGTDALGWTDDATNTGYDTAKTMADFTRAGAKNVGDVYGAGGSAGLRGDRGNHVTKLQDQVMDDYGTAHKSKYRGLLTVGRVASTAPAYLSGPGFVGAGIRGAGAAARAATGASRVPAALKGLAGGGAAHVGKAEKLKSVSGTLKALWSPSNKRVASGVLGVTGLVEAAGAGKAVVKAYREPWLPADMSEALGPEKSVEVEEQLRKSAWNFTKDWAVPESLRKANSTAERPVIPRILPIFDPLNPLDKAIGDEAWTYGMHSALNELKKTWGLSKASIPTGTNVAGLGIKRFLANYLPESPPPISAEALRKATDSVRQAGRAAGTSTVAEEGVNVGQVALPKSRSEAEELARRTGGVAGRKIGENIPPQE